MAKEILFIDSRNSFVVKGISGNFEKEGFACKVLPLDIKKIENDIRFSNSPESVFICVYEDVQNYITELKAIKDALVSINCKFFFLGFEEDIDKIIPMFPANMVEGIFKRPANAAQVAQELKSKIAGKSNANNRHILLVDDSGTLLNAMKEWLDDDYRVSVVNSATNALFFLANNKPDLILLDYAMPVCDGPQLFKMLKSEPKTKSIPVIFLTGIEDDEAMNATLNLNPDGYLLKSMSREGILSQIEAFFDTRS